MKSSKALVSSNLNETVKNIDKLSSELAIYLNLPIIENNPKQKKQLLWAVPEKKTLTLVTSSALLANQLRYKEKEILGFLGNKLNLSFNTFKIKVTPPEKPQAKETIEKRFVISEKTHGLLKNLANEIDDDNLSQVLKKMGNN